MRYQEAYELIDAGVIAGGIELPVSHNLIEIYFDQAIKEIAMRAVRKKDSQTFTASGKEYIFTKANYSGQIYKVELDQTDVPFVDESAIISNVDDDEVSKIGYYIKTDVSNGSITGVTADSPTVVTSASHGLATGDFVIFSEIKGHYVTASKVSYLNSKRLAVTKVNDNSFSVAVDSSGVGATAYSSGGVWQQDTHKLYLTKNPSSDKSEEFLSKTSTSDILNSISVGIRSFWDAKLLLLYKSFNFS